MVTMVLAKREQYNTLDGMLLFICGLNGRDHLTDVALMYDVLKCVHIYTEGSHVMPAMAISTQYSFVNGPSISSDTVSQ